MSEHEPETERLRRAGRRIRALREERGLTQVGLGKLVGVGQASISDLERGRPGAMGRSQYYRLAKILDASLDYLEGRSYVAAKYQHLEAALLRDIPARDLRYLGRLSEDELEELSRLWWALVRERSSPPKEEKAKKSG